ncbi:MAG TPA: hypothetical protein VHX49_17040, partial [Candidatus Acidoferrales bacterium]|nr:hypothetical protein [Candidatus Acidoferrales bacterium]
IDPGGTMNRRILGIGLGGILLAGMAIACPSNARGAANAAQESVNPQPCDRECLNGFVDQYLDALVAHDPSRIPVTQFVRFTENGQQLRLGDGFWRSAVKRGTYKFYIDDTNAEQVGFVGTMYEAGRGDASDPVIIALRLKIYNHKISQVETIIARGDMAQGGAKNLEKMGEPRKPFLEDLPPNERVSRLDLIMTANKYFSGMQQDDGKHDYSFFADDCNRLENGMQTTNNTTLRAGAPAGGTPAPPPSTKYDPAQHPTMYSAAWSCKDQFQSGLLHFVTRIRDRRYLIVDQERGIVFAFAFFDHEAGDTRNFETPTGEKVTAGPTTPFTWEIAEIFKISGGQLHQIEAVLTQSPYGMGSGWSNWDSSMSDQPQF